MKRILLIVVLPLAVLAAVLLFLWMYNKPHRSIVTEEADFTVSASTLISAFVDDEEAAKGKYVGKVLQVHGNVREVFQDGNTVVVVLGDDTRMAGVSFAFHKDKLSDHKVEEGTVITVKGICNGMLFDVVMDQAVLLADTPRVNEEQTSE